MRDRNQCIHAVAGVGVGVLVACAMLSGCGWQDSAAVEEAEPIELRSYEVPQEHQENLRDMLHTVLGTQGNTETRIGQVFNGPGGTLLVAAPARIQSGIEQILNADFDTTPVASPVTLTYWFLAGRPFNPADGNPPFSVAGRQVPVLEPVLAQIAGAQGPTEFVLLEHVKLSSMNEWAILEGEFGEVQQMTLRRGDQVVADVNASLQGHSFRSRVTLVAEQFLVLGHMGFSAGGLDVFPGPGAEDSLTLYCVMMADFVP